MESVPEMFLGHVDANLDSVTVSIYIHLARWVRWVGLFRFRAALGFEKPSPRNLASRAIARTHPVGPTSGITRPRCAIGCVVGATW